MWTIELLELPDMFCSIGIRHSNYDIHSWCVVIYHPQYIIHGMDLLHEPERGVYSGLRYMACWDVYNISIQLMCA